LSDGGHYVDVENPVGDVVDGTGRDHGYESDVEQVSEHNPEDLDNPFLGPDGSG
jgi:hypothetical protein